MNSAVHMRVYCYFA